MLMPTYIVSPSFRLSRRVFNRLIRGQRCVSVVKRVDRWKAVFDTGEVIIAAPMSAIR